MIFYFYKTDFPPNESLHLATVSGPDVVKV